MREKSQSDSERFPLKWWWKAFDSPHISPELTTWRVIAGQLEIPVCITCRITSSFTASPSTPASYCTATGVERASRSDNHHARSRSPGTARGPSHAGIPLPLPNRHLHPLLPPPKSSALSPHPSHLQRPDSLTVGAGDVAVRPRAVRCVMLGTGGWSHSSSRYLQGGLLRQLASFATSSSRGDVREARVPACATERTRCRPPFASHSQNERMARDARRSANIRIWSMDRVAGLHHRCDRRTFTPRYRHS
jgi:hypothetical protein